MIWETNSSMGCYSITHIHIPHMHTSICKHTWTCLHIYTGFVSEEVGFSWNTAFGSSLMLFYEKWCRADFSTLIRRRRRNWEGCRRSSLRPLWGDARVSWLSLVGVKYYPWRGDASFVCWGLTISSDSWHWDVYPLLSRFPSCPT